MANNWNSLSYHCLKNISLNEESEGMFKKGVYIVKNIIDCTKKVKQSALDLELGIFSCVIGTCLNSNVCGGKNAPTYINVYEIRCLCIRRQTAFVC